MLKYNNCARSGHTSHHISTLHKDGPSYPRVCVCVVCDTDAYEAMKAAAHRHLLIVAQGHGPFIKGLGSTGIFAFPATLSAMQIEFSPFRRRTSLSFLYPRGPDRPRSFDPQSEY